MRLSQFFGGVAVSLLLLAAACGTDKKNSAGSADGAGDASPPAAVGAAATDEEYLKVFCTGATRYQEAVNTEKTADGIAKAIKEYVAGMQSIVPPADVKPFHDAYVKHLQDSIGDPTSLLTKKAPLPPDGVRGRLADKATNVVECKFPTFLNKG